MEFLEASGIFHRRHYRFFHGTASDCFFCGSIVLRDRFRDDRIYHREETDLRRSGFRLAFSGVHYPDDQRCPVFLYGHSGTVSGESIYGSKTPSNLSGKRGNLKKRQISALFVYVKKLQNRGKM